MQPEEIASALTARQSTHSAIEALQIARDAPELGSFALVSSFGAEAAVLLHLVAVTDRTLPVIFLETGRHFTQTLVYQQELTERLRLTNVRLVKPDPEEVARTDPYGALYTIDSEACCSMRKTRPLDTALTEFDGWITGRKRYQGGARANLPVFEADAASGKIKINPLATWAPGDVNDYMIENRLPKHPLVAKGFPSIGCQTCTSPVRAGEDPRAGRWRGSDKTECGIHLAGERAPLMEIKR